MNRGALLVLPPALLAVWTVVASAVTLWGLGTLGSVGWPTWQWFGYAVTAMPTPALQGLVNPWLLIGAGVARAAVGLAAFRLFTDGRALLGIGGRELHGTSRFSTRRDGERTGLNYSAAPRPDCLILGRTKGLPFGPFARYVCLPGVEHVMVYARTGSGKGVGYVVPN